ncbi:hypothetical protein HPP92_017230 [Vanilla planifolia]|uniref:Uncharacterized protein n=1 Tax=Vanilla planifolia TaxID=51239 RepID=A0A835UN85_VANPL|nr:hypothetical protein HPP92_017230 [Vanilla planifolia]
MEIISRRSFTKDDLPITRRAAGSDETYLIGLRRRISSVSVKIQPLSASSSWTAFRSFNSSPGLIGEIAGGPLRRWWVWSWGWLFSRKLGLAKDLEMNEEEMSVHRRSLANAFDKIRAEVGKLVRSPSLPTAHTVEARVKF